jgi:hypothetical protein
MAKPTRLSPDDTKHTQGGGESQYSHFEVGSTRANWDRGAATDFAITTVNVPDRLDTQEVRARAAAEARSPSVSRFHWADVGRALRWLVALALLGAVCWGALRLAMPLRAAITRAGVQAQLSSALGVPVNVRDTELRFLPSPRLVVSGVAVQSGFSLPEVSVNFNWRDVVQGLQSATWVLGEARIAPLKLGGAEALALLNAVRGAGALPVAVSVIRFESVEFPDLTLLPGRYEAVIRRGVNRSDFNAVSLKRLDTDGQVDVEVTPPGVAGQSARFALFASRWPAVVGPAIRWNEATAQGEFTADALKVDSYSVGSGFGNLNGSALLVREGRGWKLTGNLRGPDLNVEELIRFAAGGGSEANKAPAPLRGIARFDLALAGSGASVGEALQGATASGSVSIAGATLTGLNLGVVATQGDVSGAGGATRFTDFSADASVSSSGLTVRNVAGRAGGLRVSGGFIVDRKLQLSGALRSDVASPRGVTGAQVRVAGTVSAPKYL